MMNIRMILSVVALSIGIGACGTTQSLNKQNSTLAAAVTVRDSLVVTGPILSEDATTITISAYGVSHTYEKAKVQSIERVQLPDATRMQEDVVKSAARTATNTGIIVALNLIAAVAAIILSNK